MPDSTGQQDYILFSPVGTTDPIRNNYDGPLLHIIRFYKPIKVLLFLSAEMEALEKADNRYEYCINRLANEILHIQVGVEKVYSGIKDVHHFGVFDAVFNSQIRKLHEENPEACILLNVSSGTPQMIASLYMLAATLPFSTKAIQVDTYTKAANREHAQFDPADEAYWENEWEYLFDNHPELFESEQKRKRTREISLDNVHRQILVENIKSQISNYNYTAALQLSENAPDLFSNDFLNLLRAVVLRLKGNPSNPYITNPKKFYTVRTGDKMKLYEYILRLQIKHKRDALADFACRASPAVVELMRWYIKKNFGEDINDFISLDNYGIRKFSYEDPMPQGLANRMRGNRPAQTEAQITSNTVFKMVEYYYKQSALEHPEQESKVFGLCKDLRTFDVKVRNFAAHEMAFIDDDFIQSKTGFRSQQILKKMKQVFTACVQAPPDNVTFWNDYEKMNEKLIALINSP